MLFVEVTPMTLISTDRRIAGKALLLAFSLFCVALASSTLWACPNCKDAVLADDSPGKNVAAAYNWSIIAMLAILGLVAFGLIRLMMIACREADKQSGVPVSSAAPPPATASPDESRQVAPAATPQQPAAPRPRETVSS